MVAAVTALVALVVRLLGVSPALANVIAVTAAILIALGTAWGGYELIKHWGADELRAKIEQENQDAIHKGIEAARSFDDCIARGGLWDFQRQRCSVATLGPR
jgi:high-affinity Fe2+/Pb2+ permease